MQFLLLFLSSMVSVFLLWQIYRKMSQHVKSGREDAQRDTREMQQSHKAPEDTGSDEMWLGGGVVAISGYSSPCFCFVPLFQE